MTLSFDGGINLIVHEKVLQKDSPRVKIVDWSHTWRNSAATVLGEKVCLSKLVQLTPEDVTFEKPVRLVMPACIGAETAYRSTGDTWEEVPMKILDGEVEIELEHFCRAFVAGEPHPLKAMGFIMPSLPSAKLGILHVGCPACDRNLEEFYMQDKSLLQEFERCQETVTMGNYADKEELVIHQDGGESFSELLRFRAFPFVSKELNSSADAFEVIVDDAMCCFTRASWICLESFFCIFWAPCWPVLLLYI